MKNLQKLPTLLSISRIPLSIGMIFTPAFSIPFFVIYTLAGATDALDGFLARKLNACTKTGAIIDSIADIVFFVISLIKIFTAITIPFWLWICMAVIVFIRLVNIITGFITQKKLVLLHTIANKITGFLIFLFPYALAFVNIKYAAIPVCAVAIFAAVYESVVIFMKKIKLNSIQIFGIVFFIWLSLYFTIHLTALKKNKNHYSFEFCNISFISYQGKIRIANRIIKSKSTYIKSEYKKIKEKYKNCFIISQDINYVLLQTDSIGSYTKLYLISDDSKSQFSDFYSPEIEFSFFEDKIEIKLKDERFIKHFNELTLDFSEDNEERILFTFKKDPDSNKFVCSPFSNYDINLFQKPFKIKATYWYTN